MAEEVIEPKRSVPFLGSFRSDDGSEVQPGEEAVKVEKEPEVPAATQTKEPEAAATKAPAAEPAAQTKEPEVKVIEYWKEIGAAVGEEFPDKDAVINKLKSSRDLEKQNKELATKAKYYESLDPMALDVDKAKKAGIDLDLYLEARKLDPETIEGKEALRKKFYLENPDMKSSTANILFEDEYNSKFGIITKVMDEVEAAENAPKVDLARARLEAETTRAKKFLANWKSEHVTIPEGPSGLTEEEQKKIREDYMNRASEFVSTIGELEIPVGEKSFKFGVESYLKDIEDDIKNPLETLKKFGVDLEKQEIDPEKFGEVIAKLKALNDIGGPLSKWALEQSDGQTLKEKLDLPAPTNIPAGGDPGAKTTDEKVGEAFEAFFRRRRQERI